MKNNEFKMINGNYSRFRKILKLTSIFLLLVFAQAFAQQESTVSGTVVDAEGLTMPGVSVVVNGTTNGTSTDFDGNYSIQVEDGKTLVFSFMGYSTKEVVYEGQLTLNVTLEEDSQVLEDVIVVGYGTQKKGNVTGSISSVNNDKLTIAPVASTTNALAGQLPGLISKQTSGQPGADAAGISIRGFGNALIIVDGIEADMNSIDPNQIESVSILKDGSASIYGARGGNGVILVTTKRGNEGKPVITLNSSYTLQGITAMPNTPSSGQYAQMERERWINSGRPASAAPYSEEVIQKYYDGNDPQYPNTNWKDELIRDWAPQQQHNLSVRGGSDKIKYYGFLGYMNQETMWKNSGGDYTRYNLQSNIDAQILDNLTLKIDIASTIEARRYPLRGMEAGNMGVWTDFWNTLPIYPATLPDPSKISYANGSGTGGAHISSNRNLAGYNDTDSQNMRGSVSLQYDFKALEGLSAKAFMNYNQYYSSNKKFSIPSETYTYNYDSDIYTFAGAWGDFAKLDQAKGDGRVITSQLSLNYDNTFGKENQHHFSALALYETISGNNSWLSGGRQNFLSPEVDQIFAGSTNGMYINGWASESGRASYVGRLNYSYKEKYLIETIFRADASAKFPDDYKWGYFPSVSLGWRISEENFIKNIEVIDNLKLRASYGQSGIDGAMNFDHISAYVPNSLFTYILEDSQQSAIVSTGIANPNLTWYEMTTYNVGLDFAFFGSKLYGEGDVFYRSQTGLHGKRYGTVPSTFGADLPEENLNSDNTKGFEFLLGTRGSNGDFVWNVSANISWSRTKWDHYEEPEFNEDEDQKRLYTVSGQWADRALVYTSNGIFTSQEQIDALNFDQDQKGNSTIKPGDIRYVDSNNDGLLDWRDMKHMEGTIPHWMFGLNTTLNYKDFDLTALFQGAFGYNYLLNLEQTGLMLPAVVFDERWTEDNNNADALFPRLGGAWTNSLPSDFNYKSAGYVRLKTASIGYSLSKNVLQRVKLEKLRVYLAGTNLLTFDNLGMYGIDPEAPSGASGKYYPQQRTVTLGMSLSL